MLVQWLHRRKESRENKRIIEDRKDASGRGGKLGCPERRAGGSYDMSVDQSVASRLAVVGANPMCRQTSGDRGGSDQNHQQAAAWAQGRRPVGS